MNNGKKLHSSSRSLLCSIFVFFTFNKNLFTMETSRNTVFVYGSGRGGGGLLLGMLGGAVLPGSSNPDPISDQKM